MVEITEEEDHVEVVLIPNLEDSSDSDCNYPPVVMKVAHLLITKMTWILIWFIRFNCARKCQKIIMYNYIIDATAEHAYHLTPRRLDAVLGVIIFTMSNRRLSQKDYWSTST